MTRLFVAMVMMTSVSAVRFETAEGPSMCDRQLRVKDMEEAGCECFLILNKTRFDGG